jgi:hypothetical protein
MGGKAQHGSQARRPEAIEWSSEDESCCSQAYIRNDEEAVGRTQEENGQGIARFPETSCVVGRVTGGDGARISVASAL